MTYTYEFVDYGGVDNCQKCDYYTGVWEYNRNDGKPCFFCINCRPDKEE